MRHAILLILLLLQIIGFGLMAAEDYSHAGGVAMHFLAFLQTALLGHAPLIVLTLALGLTVAAGSIDVSLPALSASIACAMIALGADDYFYTHALPLAVALAVGIGAILGVLVGRSFARGLVVTFVAAELLRVAAVAISGGDAGSFGLVQGYDRFASVPFTPVTLFACFMIVGLTMALARWPRAGSSTASRAGAFALAGLLAAVAAVLESARTGVAPPDAMTGTAALVLAAAAIAGSFRPDRPAGAGALLLASLNIAVLLVGWDTLGYLADEAWDRDPAIVALGAYPCAIAAAVVCVALDRRRGHAAARDAL